MHICSAMLLDVEKRRSTECERAIELPDDEISFSEKRISQRALAAKTGPRIVKWR